MARQHQQRFLALSQLLVEDQHLWRPAPFMHHTLAWQCHLPELSRGCLGLEDAELDTLERDPQALLSWLESFLPQLVELRHLTRLTRAPVQPLDFPKYWDVGIRGRKAAQIQAFAACLQPAGELWLDWCCGKAHLGRALSQLHSVPCLAVERDSHLCVQGQRLAQQRQLPLQFINTDVLKSGLLLPQEGHVLALHACGDLHRSLVRELCQRQVKALSLVPCCYPLWVGERFEPLSNEAQQIELVLDRHDLHLAVQESVTSSAREMAQSHQLQAWRLGFDLLQRQLRGEDAYLQTPSTPPSVLHKGFEGLCRELASKVGLAIADNIDWDYFLLAGLQRYRQVRRLQLVRHAYRRALELWLVLDVVLCLEEAGYTVTMHEFCERALSPRNVFIDARCE